MSDEKVGIGIPLTSTADTSGADKMADALGKTAGKAKEAGEAAQKTKTDFAALGESLVALVGAAGLIEFLRESVQEFYEEEKAIRAVSGAAQIWGQDAGKAKAEAEAFGKSMAQLSGIADNQLTAALGKQYLALGDMAQAQSRVALAMDISTRMGWDFGKAMTTVEQAANGQGRELAKLIPEIKGAKDAHEAGQIAVDGLEKRFRGATLATHDHALAVDQSHVRWQQFTKEVGGVVLPLLTGLRDGFVIATQAVVDLASRGVARIIELGGYIGALGGLLKNVWTGPKEAVMTFIKDIANTQKEYQEASEALDDDAYRKEKARTTDLVDMAKKAAATKMKANDDLHVAGVKHFNENARYMTAEFLHEQALLEQRRKAFTSHLTWMNKEMKRIDQETLKDVKEHWKSQEEIMRASTRDMAKRYADFAKLKYELEASVLTGTLELLGESFGMQKEMAIATATINAAGAIISALAAPYPMDIILPILVAAEAALQIAKISSQSAPSVGAISASSMKAISSGFDDPANDRAAYLGGRKWAGDMIREFSGGASAGISAGWAAGMGGSHSTVNNNSRVTNINVSGGLIDPNQREWMKQFGRKLAIVMQADGQRTVARRT